MDFHLREMSVIKVTGCKKLGMCKTPVPMLLAKSFFFQSVKIMTKNTVVILAPLMSRCLEKKYQMEWHGMHRYEHT